MMAFTKEGQAYEDMIAARDKKWGVDSKHKKKNRADIKPPAKIDGADNWEKSGMVLQYHADEVSLIKRKMATYSAY